MGILKLLLSLSSSQKLLVVYVLSTLFGNIGHSTSESDLTSPLEQIKLFHQGLELDLFYKLREVNTVVLAPLSMNNPFFAERYAFMDLLLSLEGLELVWVLLYQLGSVLKLKLECFLGPLSVPLELALTPHVRHRVPYSDDHVD